MRLPDWKERLRDRILADQDRAFTWGEHDCILFACTCIEAMTGIDPAVEYRGTYRSAREARSLLKRLGVKSPADAMKSHFGEIFPAIARAGDIVACPTPTGWDALGVVFNGVIIAPDAKALATGPLIAAKRAFRID